jgi:mycothiol synthase
VPVVIETATSLSPDDAAAVRALATAAGSADGVAPLSEQTLLRLADDSGAIQHLLARRDGQVVGYAELEATGPGENAEFAAELIVGPHHRRQGIGRELAEAAITLAGAAQLRVWAHGDGAGARALAEQMGFVRSRVLLQMRRDLAGELPEAQWPPGMVVRTFKPGADEVGWLAVNAAAFATHPEQGRWQMADLEQRESQDWFDPHGFFLAERDGTLVGFHWTKVHRDERPPIGEVYVVGVLPEAAGQGLGRALTLAGLHHLQGLGLGSVLLYVDESNVAALKTYERLGFSRWATDVMYSRQA